MLQESIKPGLAALRIDDHKRSAGSAGFHLAAVHLTSPGAFQQFKDAVTSEPRLNVEAMRAVDC
jgi:hypothetical protein